MDRPSFVAILYVNRSGSTLFSRLLSDHSPEACILPELGFPVRFLLARRHGERLSDQAMFEAIYADPRFAALGISAEQLRSVCAGRSSDDLAELLQALAAACMGRPVATVVFKLETLLHVAEEAVAAFPGLRFVHLFRDPRSVVSSMLRTPVPEKPGFDMARGSLVYAARHWARYIEGVRRLAAQHDIVPVRYEDLGSADGHPGLARMGLAVGNGAQGKPSAYRIAPLDGPLHGRIYDDFDAALIGTWRDELRRDQAAVVEKICAGPMRALGYVPEAGPPPGAAALCRLHLRHGLAMVRHYWRTLGIYLAGPEPGRRLRDRLRLSRRV